MPNLKNNQTRKRALRTPNAEILTKYEQIALLSTVYSQTQIIHKLGNDKRGSYGTITTAMKYFQTKRLHESDHEWTVVLGTEFRFEIRMVNWTNRKTTYDIITPDPFNQFLADKLADNINTPLEFRIEYMDYQFFDLSIISIEDLSAIFHALIWDSINPLLQTRYSETITLGPDNRSIIINPKEILPTEETIIEETLKDGKKRKKQTIGKSKIIATKSGLILL